MRILVTRPRPDAEAQAARLRAMGHEPVVVPLLAIAPDPACPLPAAGVQALLATSRNAVRALEGRDQLEALRALPLYAVGDATAAVARAMGFARVETAGDDGASLAAQVAADCDPRAGPLLHLSGEHVAFDLGLALDRHGFEVRRATIYRAVETEEAGEGLPAALPGLDAVILMSPRTARRFAALVARLGLDEPARAPRYYCMSLAVAEGLAGLGRLRLSIPVRPAQDDLLALIDGQAADCR